MPASSHTNLPANINAEMSASDSSELSSPPTTDDESISKNLTQLSGLDRYFKPAPKGIHKVHPSPPPPKRPASPPHEYVLADNPAIAVRCCCCTTTSMITDILYGSLLLCFVRVSTMSFQNHCPTTDHKTSREVLLNPYRTKTSRSCYAHCLGWS